MNKIVLIQCVSQKLPHRAKAKDLYASTLFKGNLRYAMRLKPDKIFILSAKYGLLGPDTEIEPYDLTLNTMREAEIKAWASSVLASLQQQADLQHDHFIILAGERYRRYLVPSLPSYEVPMKGLTIGRQLHFLKEMQDE